MPFVHISCKTNRPLTDLVTILSTTITYTRLKKTKQYTVLNFIRSQMLASIYIDHKKTKFQQ